MPKNYVYTPDQKASRAITMAAYAMKNNDKIKAYQANYRKENSGKARESFLKWAKDNPERLRMTQKVWAEKNRDAVKKIHKAWRDGNREKLRHWGQLRRSRTHKSMLSESDIVEIRALYVGGCVRCSRKDNLSLDHIIPVSKGGKHIRENIQILCRSCNSKKGAKLEVGISIGN